jgi:hypothetical protein
LDQALLVVDKDKPMVAQATLVIFMLQVVVVVDKGLT